MQGARLFIGVAVAAVVGLGAAVYLWPTKPGITIYCAADDVHAQPILDDFVRETGIPIREVKYDVEANKTVSLVAALRIERDRPRCDVYWNNEPLHTMMLADEGLFESYSSASAADIPAQFKDAKGRWTGFAARARILIVNTDLVKSADMPKSMDDLLDPKWKGRAGLARPLAGTTLTQVATLFTVLGREKVMPWTKGLFENSCVFPTGNGPLATAVATGQLAWGFTDTDDFRKCEAEGKPVVRVFPDQEPGKPGTLVLPNTLALVKGCREPELAKKLIDYLLRKEVEEKLAASDGAHIPLRASVKRPPYVQGPPQFREMDVDWSDVAKHYDERMKQLEALWQ
ncbi:MAG: extracellular solute-binding protein [Planctomycetes bacterium]|nr:extracellular solute-binding protein [Planctomycetota bacterium]